MKTTAVRILDQMKITYELREYEVNEDELDAITVANKINWPAEQVFKTLVARSSRGAVLMACVPATSELNLKILAQIVKDKRVDLVPVKEIQTLTGYIRGGVSPLGTKKTYPLYLDISALNYDKISISAGKRGLQILIAPKDLEIATQTTIIKITAK
ncbi:MAG: Cys-tRNA(Pro) deacylase [Acidobacteria bacterium]|nr:Cys-tRNA(Pro) deacylase [Acidobacteriota bacterium]